MRPEETGRSLMTVSDPAEILVPANANGCYTLDPK